MSFTVFLSSFNGTADATAQNGIVSYNIDWGATPEHEDDEGEYELTFAFVSRAVSTTTDTLFLPVVNWGARHNAFTPTSSSGANYTLALGAIRSNVNATAGQTTAGTNQNVPIIVKGKPKQNQFTVSLVNVDGTIFAMGTAHYILSIYFRCIKKDEGY